MKRGITIDVDRWFMTSCAAFIGIIAGIMRYQQRQGDGGEILSGVLFGGAIFIVLMYLIWRGETPDD